MLKLGHRLYETYVRFRLAMTKRMLDITDLRDSQLHQGSLGNSKIKFMNTILTQTPAA